jgi:hypothetical protein
VVDLELTLGHDAHIISCTADSEASKVVSPWCVASSAYSTLFDFSDFLVPGSMRVYSAKIEMYSERI